MLTSTHTEGTMPKLTISARVDALTAAVEALLAAQAKAPTKAKAKTETVVARINACACGREFRFGRTAAVIGEGTLCSVKGLAVCSGPKGE